MMGWVIIFLKHRGMGTGLGHCNLGSGWVGLDCMVVRN